MRPHFNLPSHHHLNFLLPTKWHRKRNGTNSRTGFQVFSLQRAGSVTVSASTKILFEYDPSLPYIMQDQEASSKMLSISL
jgi:hypothetical protein